MELEEMQRLAESALEGGWDQVLLPAADVLALRPAPRVVPVKNNSLLLRQLWTIISPWTGARGAGRKEKRR